MSAWRPAYGVDALPVPVVMGVAGLVSGAAAVRWPRGRTAAAAIGSFLLANAAIYLHTSLRGKHRVWERELDRLALSGDEDLLDLGCGRGAVLIAAARRLPKGRATGPSSLRYDVRFVLQAVEGLSLLPATHRCRAASRFCGSSNRFGLAKG